MTESIYDLVLKEFDYRKCAHVDIYPKHFVCSLGAHIFNLVNQEIETLIMSSIPVDTRQHVMFVAPPGFSKTFWMEQFVRGSWSILHNTDVQHGFEGSTTEAGFVGSATLIEGEAVITPGLAKVYEWGICAFEEFSALTAMMRSHHSRQLDAALLLALDKGYVVKRLRAGRIGYKTNVSVWCGTQPARFDLSSGLGRRFYYLLLIPSRADRELIRKKMREGWNVRMNKKRTDRIRRHINELKDRLYDIRTVVKMPDINALFDDLNIEPYEEPLFIRQIIGYWVIKEEFDKDLSLKLDDELINMCWQQAEWRQAIRRGPEIAEVFEILNAFGGKMDLLQWKDEMLRFGVDWRRSSELAEELKRMRVIALGENTITLKKRWRKEK